MNVKWLRVFRGVARSLRNEICILAPGSCIPECHANLGWRSRNSALGRFDREGNSLRAIAIARDAGPKPMQIKSRGVSCREEGLLCQEFVSKEPH